MKPVKDNLNEIEAWYERNKDTAIVIHTVRGFFDGLMIEHIGTQWNIVVAEHMGASSRQLGTSGPAALQIFTLTDEFEILHGDSLLINYTPSEKTLHLCSRGYNRLVVSGGTKVNAERVEALLDIGTASAIALKLGVEDDN